MGAVTASVNGGNAAAGAAGATGAELAADYLISQLPKDKYPEAINPLTGEIDPNRLPEEVKSTIRDLSSAVASVAGGITGGNISNAQIAGVAGMNAVENNYLSEDRLMYYSKKLRNCTNKKECDQIIQQMNEEDERNRKLLTDICSKDRFSKACRDQIGNAQSGDDMVYTPIDNNNLDGVRGKFLVTDLCGINQTCINTFLEQDRKNKADTEFGKEKTIKQQASQIKQYPIYKYVDFSEMTDEEIYNFHNQMLLGIVLSGGSKLAGKTSGRKNSPNSQGEKGSNKINVAEALKKSFRIFNDNISAGKGSNAGKGTTLPNGYTSQGTNIVGPKGGVYTNTGQVDAAGNPIYTNNGAYYTFENGAKTKVSSPNTNTSSQVQKNYQQGKQYEQTKYDEFSSTQEKSAREVTLETENGTKIRLDMIGKDKNGNITCIECKSSDKAPLTPNQKVGFPDLEKNGGTIIGDGKPGFEGGTKIPPTKVEVARPDN